ncbi:MAG: hypothetical protein NZ739_03395 [Verrucomicrobiae bacterium]|nr:hypothetical protein [Verrucomicrobiae bacterium]MDW7979866.1 hypothetical protein [Verrucomicrobiales bacterium]
MRSPRVHYLILLLLVVINFTLATVLDIAAQAWTRRGGTDLLAILLGDARRIFSAHFFIKADVYFHAGYYPSIFDLTARPKDSSHMAGDNHAHDEEKCGKAMQFLGRPTDWIERFGRNFAVTEHKHLNSGKEREILPWLRISASLDPHRIETYTVAAFWLRRTLGKPEQAEAFLREGLRANPDSYELLHELGCVYYENYKDAARARNIWRLALEKLELQRGKKDEDELAKYYHDILLRLARLEEDQGNYALAADYLEEIIERNAAPNPDLLRTQITELREKASTRH